MIAYIFRPWIALMFVVIGPSMFSVSCAAHVAEKLIADISTGKIGSFTVVIRNNLNLVPNAVSPEDFYSFASKSCTIKFDDPMQNDFIVLLRSTTLADGQENLDVYWRVGFYNNIGNEIHTLYMGRSFYDGNAVAALLDRDKVLVKQRFVEWLENITAHIGCSKIIRQ